jgi:BirA family biotin operon repressor/biotin-[acetyl-CoA-carboxylase] ligase
MLDPSYLKRHLDFKDYILLETIDSTNNYIAKIIKKGKTSVLVAADEQTNGRGRFSRKWSSETGGLYFSFTGKISDINYNYQLSPIACAMGVFKTLDYAGVPNLIYKWPNDILVGKKKISGILLEITEDTIIAGIGVNANIREFQEDISKTATSLFLIKRREYDLNELLCGIIAEINKINTEKEILNFLKDSGMIGKRVKFTSVSRNINGTVFGFRETGEIEIDIDGEVESFIAGDVSFLREDI